MRVHLAGKASGARPHTLPAQAAIAEQHPFTLATYAYPDDIAWWEQVWHAVPGSVVIMDSGAFTAHTQGREITVAEYGRFIDEVTAHHGSRLAELHFMALDVIGDQRATWRNLGKLEKLGHQVIPVLTYGAQAGDVKRAADYPYVALGGLVGAPRARLQPWLDGVFNILTREDFPRVHLLGLTQEWALRRYPAFSCDSSSWLRTLRFGLTELPGIDKVPSYSTSAAATAMNVASLRKEVQRMTKMQNEATRLWAQRGVVWN